MGLNRVDSRRPSRWKTAEATRERDEETGVGRKGRIRRGKHILSVIHIGNMLRDQYESPYSTKRVSKNAQSPASREKKELDLWTTSPVSSLGLRKFTF